LQRFDYNLFQLIYHVDKYILFAEL